MSYLPEETTVSKKKNKEEGRTRLGSHKKNQSI
jgi:hypothetical protein